MSASNSLHYELCKLGASYVRRRGFHGGQTPNKFAPKLAMMAKKCPRFKRILEEVELKLIEK